MKLLNQYCRPILGSLLIFSISFAQAHPKIQSWRSEKPIQAAVVEVRDLKNLGLYLYDIKHSPYLSFTQLNAALRKKCRNMQFAMNAGMFQADYSPVGLYIENGIQQRPLNTAKRGFGNFLIQPNGVLAWNNSQAVIQTTDHYRLSSFKAKYATQSGPMLVIDGKINDKFLSDASSYKIRNGAGIQNHKLYFVISLEPVTFYQFASYFKDTLKTGNALYLDGSISSMYAADLNMHDAARDLGPMAAYSEPLTCK